MAKFQGGFGEGSIQISSSWPFWMLCDFPQSGQGQEQSMFGGEGNVSAAAVSLVLSQTGMFVLSV